MSSVFTQIRNAALKTTMQLGMIASSVSLVASNVLYTIDQSNNYSDNSSFNNYSNKSSSFVDDLFNGEYNPHIKKLQAIIGLFGAIVASSALIPQIRHNHKTKTAPFKLDTLFLFITSGFLGIIATASVTDVSNYPLWVANATNIILTLENTTLLIQNLMYSKKADKEYLSPEKFSQEINKFLKIFTKNNQNEPDQIVDIYALIKQISLKNKDLLDNNDELKNEIEKNIKEVLGEFKANIENNLKTAEKNIVDLNKEIEETKMLLNDLKKQNTKKHCNRYCDRNLQNNIKKTKKDLNELEKTKQELNNGLEALSKLGKFLKKHKQNQFQQELINENTTLVLKNVDEHKPNEEKHYNSSINGTVW